MKDNKKLLVIAVLVLLITISFTTYAIYKSSATGTDSVKAAAWVVKVNNTDIVENDTFTANDITWANTRIGKNDTIAPGDHGTVDVVIDATGSEVDVDYAISEANTTYGKIGVKVWIYKNEILPAKKKAVKEDKAHVNAKEN